MARTTHATIAMGMGAFVWRVVHISHHTRHTTNIELGHFNLYSPN